MEALLALEPRVAGTQVREPRAAFDSVEEAAHAAVRCPISCIVRTGQCIETGGRSFV
jgi:hypothetical protein